MSEATTKKPAAKKEAAAPAPAPAPVRITPANRKPLAPILEDGHVVRV